MLSYLTSLVNTLWSVKFHFALRTRCGSSHHQRWTEKNEKNMALFVNVFCLCWFLSCWFWILVRLNRRMVGSRIPWPRGRGQDTNFFVVSLYGQLFPHGNFNVFVRFDCNFQRLSNIFDGSCDFHDANNIDHHCMIKSQHVLNIFSALRILSWFLLWNHWCHF